MVTESVPVPIVIGTPFGEWRPSVRNSVEPEPAAECDARYVRLREVLFLNVSSFLDDHESGTRRS